MKWDCILLRYGELALKGKNKKDFENKLVQNLRKKLQAYPVTIRKGFGRLFVDLADQEAEPIIEELQQVFGLVGFSPAVRVPSTLEAIQEAVPEVVEQVVSSIRTFKVIGKRADKRFPVRSNELNQTMGALVLQRYPELKVDLHNPDLRLHIEVRDEATYIYGNDIAGAGGLPVGTSGRVMLLLSGGIDSPVAGYLTAKRGARVSGIHFHSYPFTSERAKQKVIDLARILTPYTGDMDLYMVPFTEIQTAIRQHCSDPYSITIMRRLMLRIAEKLAEKHHALALATGESMGQVASQTLESMNTINAVTSTPILRPLIGMDKLEIMEIAKKIGTYETSILPYEDCCTVFVPQSPKTKPQIEATEREEARLEVELLVDAAVEQTERLRIETELQTEFTYFS